MLTPAQRSDVLHFIEKMRKQVDFWENRYAYWFYHYHGHYPQPHEYPGFHRSHYADFGSVMCWCGLIPAFDVTPEPELMAEMEEAFDDTPTPFCLVDLVDYMRRPPDAISQISAYYIHGSEDEGIDWIVRIPCDPRRLWTSQSYSDVDIFIERTPKLYLGTDG